MTNEQIARAFSGHRFEEVLDRIAPDATWTLVGEHRLQGREAIVDACRRAGQEDGGVEVTWPRFVSTGSGDVVAVDAIGRYAGDGAVSVVSSCDVYEFTGDLVTAITTYAVELPEDGS